MPNWCKFTKAELDALYAQHRTVAKVGEATGFSEETIRRRMKKVGSKCDTAGGKRSFNPSKRDLEGLYQKMSMRDIARQYGVGETVVFKRLKEHGVVLKDYEGGGHRLKPGRKFSKSHRENLSKALSQGQLRGPNSPNWKGGATEKMAQLRRSGAYKRWKLQSLERANYRCQKCGAQHKHVCKCCGTKVILHVHHIKSFAKYPDSRFDPENSEVLCPKCHYELHHGKTG